MSGSPIITRFTSIEANFTGFETKAEESEEKSISGSRSNRTIMKIILKPQIIFSVRPRASPLFFNESFWRYYIREYNDEPDYFVWVVDILPEDIGPAD